MPDYSALLNVMKQAGVNANQAGNPVKICFGGVVSISPLKVLVDQKILLGKAQLILTDTVDGKLSKNDCVLLLRMQGGQKFVVIDKVVNES